MAKQARAEATRDAILTGAAEVFDRYGYGSTTLSDVIARSGVTKGALYFHFSSKEELARAVVAEHQNQLAKSSEESLAEPGHSLESAIRLSQWFARRLVQDVVARAGVRLTLEQGTFGGISAESYRQWVDVIEQLLRRSMDEGDVRAGTDSDSLARFVVASFTGVQMLSQVFTGRTDLMFRVQEMWDVVLPAIVLPRKLAHFRGVAAQDGATG